MVGDRDAADKVHYSDIDLAVLVGSDSLKGFYHKDGRPYPKLDRS